MKRILVPVDFSDATDDVVATAEQLAQAMGAKLWLLHCVSDPEPADIVGEVPAFVPKPNLPARELYEAEYRKLTSLLLSLRMRGVDAEEIFVVGSVIDEILLAADQHNVDLLVVGSHGHGALYDLLIGTVTHSVLQRVGRPTLIVPTHKRSATMNRDLEPATTESMR